MILKHLRVAQLRAFEQAEFEFRPSMNLLVGINGVGKSTVLDALRMLLSQVLPEISGSRSKALRFTTDDITVGRDVLDVELVCGTGDVSFSYLVHKPREENVSDPDREGQVRHQTIETPERTEWTPASRTVAEQLGRGKVQPLAVYFSSHRSLPDLATPPRQSASGGRAAAFAESLEPRRLRIREIIDWWLAREALAREGLPSAHRQLDALNEAVLTFLDGCDNLRAVKEPKPTLLIDKAGMTLDVRQLSDGERGVLALVLDLTRRLAQANPRSGNPAHDGSAVVLVDELDLHLHPLWQRSIAQRLTNTFPRCQFIATTHSPLIISEVEPEGITVLLRDAERVMVRRAGQSYGLDVNWILDHLMGGASRPKPAQDKINEIEDALEEGELNSARRLLEGLREMLHGYDGEVARLEASINTLEALADEVDPEES